jgi:hypothetical protein
MRFLFLALIWFCFAPIAVAQHSNSDREPALPDAAELERTEIPHRSNWETLKNKSLWTYAAADILAGAFDAEMSHAGYAHHRCVEGGDGLPRQASRAQLYRHDLPENVAVLAFGYLGTRLKMPRWLLFTTEAYPVQNHIRAGLQWRQDCW